MGYDVCRSTQVTAELLENSSGSRLPKALEGEGNGEGVEAGGRRQEGQASHVGMFLQEPGPEQDRRKSDS